MATPALGPKRRARHGSLRRAGPQKAKRCDLARHGDFGDLAPASLRDPIEALAQRPAAPRGVLGRLDQRPAQGARSLL